MSRPSSRANSRAVGLPNSPSPRSRSGSLVSGQTGPVTVSRHRSTASECLPPTSFAAPMPPHRLPEHSLRHHRSAGSLPSHPAQSRSFDRRGNSRAYSPPPPLPLPKVGQAVVATGKGDNNGVSAISAALRKRSDASVSSWSSSSSVFSASSQQGSHPGYASSATSIEEVPPYERKGDDDGAAKSSVPTTPPNSVGSSLWKRVAAVTDTLTVNVSKAWAASLSPDAGEATPIGQESRLTRAMKAYHINKARSRSDLPEWLFEERDRGASVKLRITIPDAPVQMPRVGREAHIYVENRRERDFPPSSSQESEFTSPDSDARLPGTTLVDRSRTHSRDALNRLKELRMTKRNARVHFAEVDDEVIPASTISPRPAYSPLTFPPVPKTAAAPGYDPAPWIGRMPPRKAPTPPAGSIRGKQDRSRVGLPSAVKLKA
ncbi:hypothetical protein BKA93DRAFT_821812 [Sparassis latifolia]